MGQKKQSYTGFVKIQHVGGSSKSGRNTHVLDTGDGHPIPLRLQNGNAMRDPAFDPFVNMRVTIQATPDEHNRYLMVENIRDVVLLGPPGRAVRPPRP